MAGFDVVSSRVSFPELDAEILDYWKERDVFRRSMDDRPDAPLFMMYEGPPTANGSPGIHHVLARVFKDVISRYRTMKGCRVIRKGRLGHPRPARGNGRRAGVGPLLQTRY